MPATRLDALRGSRNLTSPESPRMIVRLTALALLAAFTTACTGETQRPAPISSQPMTPDTRAPTSPGMQPSGMR